MFSLSRCCVVLLGRIIVFVFWAALSLRRCARSILTLSLSPWQAEFATHSRIRGLSGGQKVKVVIAGCMWNNPHILVMDEPTNYLDRDSLGALSGAIRNYGGTLCPYLPDSLTP